MTCPVLQLRLRKDDGSVVREVVLREDISLKNLHTLLQLCLKPSQRDKTIDDKKYSFKTKDKEIKAKSSKLYSSVDTTNAKPGLLDLQYLCDGSTFKFDLIQRKLTRGDYTPRCCKGTDQGQATDLDPINKKLLGKRFSTRASQSGKKKLPGMIVDAATITKEELMQSHMARMRSALKSEP